ncbi:hypothetical protein N1851_022153 [Merluccius polli]|uniref:Integrase zinc-binding domain-containing protein n=1 Tax=Merluccius polli TaxID=89951 RepID=A0AA47MIC5_MERPO|nr:hypothetical protein N1851_022153 [Merluccius polli]
MAVKQDHGGSARIHENLRDEKTQELRGRSVSQLRQVHSNRIAVVNLDDLVRQNFNHDFPEKVYEEKAEMSIEDKRFMHIMSTSGKKIDGHYQLKLPFKKDDLSMPNNRAVVEQRALGLKRKLRKNTSVHQEYHDFLADVIKKGHAEIVPQNQLMQEDGKVWYLPHHSVWHPKKHKIRVVFECAAHFKGTSLNEELIQGPNLTNTLLGVLIRFRQEPVAVMADIEGMYHQVKVRSEDSNFLRFLWWPNGDIEYRMKASCASYALKRTAEDNCKQYPKEAVETVLNNFYVDDCLKSVPTEAEAIKLSQELTSLCAQGGFRLTKWISNSRAVLAAIPGKERAKEVKDLDLDKECLPVDRALGVEWSTEDDSFRFHVTLKTQTFTRRAILSIIASVYDPIGFLAPFTFTAKYILQELCKLSCGWDDEIPSAYHLKWQQWLIGLRHMESYKVNRCIKPKKFGAIASAPLHSFCDAKENWPYSPVDLGSISHDDPEIKKDKVTVNVIQTSEPNPTDQLIHYFSTWTKLQRAVAWFLRLKSLLQHLRNGRKKVATSMPGIGKDQAKQMELIESEMKAFKSSMGAQKLTLEDLRSADDAIVQLCQMQNFSEEIMSLKSENKKVKRQSPIFKLDPKLDNGILRVGGRLSRLAMPEETKHPVILPKNHHVSRLILENIHRQIGHCGRNYMLRQKYWIPCANTLSRKIINDCVKCRRL